MDRSSDKLYHKHHHDSRTLLETYFSRNPDRAFKDDTLRAPMEKLRKAFNMGHLTGKLLIDISAGPLIHHLYFACEYFQEIILMRTNEQCIIEIMEWHDDRTRAFCWEHMTAHVTNLEGRRSHDISGGPQIHQLYTACEFFQEIILMRPTEECIMEIMKWLDDRTGAFCWGHVALHVTDLEGRRSTVSSSINC
ncbi:indolethylamine N-methyltransferase-like isoform X2 [Hyperolius riggenbachi]|uniref:indolethylamine N-methyltransferase-like isoform X2 n=1 Tax=Hyperolius riggenbachi TaxID=752182 RepID=UPI0035A3758D